MIVSPFEEAKIKKGYEVAYGVCRIAEVVQNPWANAFMRVGVELFEQVLGYDQAAFSARVTSLEYLIKLGAGLGFVSQSNADLLLSQCGLLVLAFDAALANQATTPAPLAVDLSDIFMDGFGNQFEVTHPVSHDSDLAQKQESNPISTDSNFIEPDIISGNHNRKSFIDDSANHSYSPLPDVSPESSDDNSGFSVSLSSGIRQSAILNRIRQSGNCRMKDLQDMFPQTSERTLRYDLEYLIGKKLIERVGAGSATSYRPREEDVKGV